MKLKCQKSKDIASIVAGVNFPVGKCPRVSYPKWKLAVGGNCQGGNFPKENCTRVIYSRYNYLRDNYRETLP